MLGRIGHVFDVNRKSYFFGRSVRLVHLTRRMYRDNVQIDRAIISARTRGGNRWTKTYTHPNVANVFNGRFGAIIIRGLLSACGGRLGFGNRVTIHFPSRRGRPVQNNSTVGGPRNGRTSVVHKIYFGSSVLRSPDRRPRWIKRRGKRRGVMYINLRGGYAGGWGQQQVATRGRQNEKRTRR